MTTEKIRVSSLGVGMEDALTATEKLGAEGGLENKQLLHLRLLAEELFGMLRSIAGDVEADYWLDREGRAYTLHLASKVELNRERRDQLISVSSTGKNQAAKGFMGKLREMIALALLPDRSGISALSGFSVGLMGVGGGNLYSAQQTAADAFRWSMQEYRQTLDGQRASDAEANAAWDELEKSIVASIADEVTVGVVGSDVEIGVYKTF